MKSPQQDHHSLVRKSPRLSSIQLPHQQHKPTSKTRPDFNNAWALSLHVVDPQPLKICHPSEEEEDGSSHRRSARFTTNLCITPIQENRSSSMKKLKGANELSALGVSSLRRKSPRFSPGLTLRNGKTVDCSEELGSSLKRRHSEGNGADAGRMKKSMLLTFTTGENGNSDLGLLALPEPGSGSLSRGDLSERSLRSRNVLIKKIDSKRSGGGSGVSQKCLRSGSAKAVKKRILRTVSKESALSDKFLRSRNVKAANELSALGLPSLRRKSPRFSPGLTLRNGKTVDCSEELGSSLKRRHSEGNGADAGRMRKSMRLTFTTGENGNSDLGLLALPEPGSGSLSRGDLSERSLRSRNVLIKKIDSKRSGGGSGVSQKCLRSGSAKDVKKRILRTVSKESALSDKFLRSRNVLMHVGNEKEKQKCDSSKVNVDGNDEKETDLIVWNDCKDTKSADKGRKWEKDEKSQKKIVCCFVGDPIPEGEAREKWGWRYELKDQRNSQRRKIIDDDEDEIMFNVDRHYAQARMGTVVLNIGHCVYVKGEGTKKHIGKILEFFKSVDGKDYFRVQWFYRAEETVLKDAASFHDKRRLFYSTVTNDNLLDCIISKVHVVKLLPEQCLESNPIASAAFYYDMEYCVEYTTFRNVFTETSKDVHDSLASNSRHGGGEPNSPKLLALLPNIESSKPELSLLDIYSGCGGMSTGLCVGEPNSPKPLALLPNIESSKPELSLLDIYSGCGGMSTGLCVGTKLSGLNLVTKWAVDFDSSACDSLKLNHPETKVRNESVEDFLGLLRQWKHLCDKYVIDLDRTANCEFVEAADITPMDIEDSSGEFEVSHLVNICYGDPCQSGKPGLHFLVSWKGYGPDEDTWEPVEGLENCRDRIQDFVRKGFQSKILPLPGDVGVICGGPPCQGISGYNRYRNFESPLEDERNRQIVIFMDIVEFLQPKYVLMENVVDIIRFDKASLGRYALSRLVHMKYQARLGIIASGCYGVPQFRLRVFIWGAHHREKLPQFPLPTHDVIVRYWPPPQFERNIVAYDEGQPRTIQESIILRDAISDLPPVTNDEPREEMAYDKDPETKFQTYIRLCKNEVMGFLSSGETQMRKDVLYDHRPLQMSENDYLRVCQIPREKGANFRNLPGIVVGEDNVARRDPTKEPVTLPSGALLVPDSILAFEQGKSKRPYARLWWDETVSTVVTFPHVRAQAILHPEQDRVLTIRECARLQGFPDIYRFCGTIKERYRQVGNAVSVPVGRALGYALGMAYYKAIDDKPLLILPPNFY